MESDLLHQADIGTQAIRYDPESLGQRMAKSIGNKGDRESMTNIISKIEALSQRLERAREIVESGLVEDIGGGIYIVLSQRGKEHYTVDPHGCECADCFQRFDLTKGYCKHRLAVELFKEAQTESKTLSPEEFKETVESLYGPSVTEAKEEEKNKGRKPRATKPKRAA